MAAAYRHQLSVLPQDLTIPLVFQTMEKARLALNPHSDDVYDAPRVHIYSLQDETWVIESVVEDIFSDRWVSGGSVRLSLNYDGSR